MNPRNVHHLKLAPDGARMTIAFAYTGYLVDLPKSEPGNVHKCLVF